MEIKKKLTAVVADDFQTMLSLLRQTLTILDCEVLAVADNGIVALEKIDLLKPDLVFLDIEMPGMTGLQVLDSLQSKGIDVFKVIVSSHTSVDNVKLALARGADGFVVKPYSTSKIKQVIDKYYAGLE